MIGQELEVLLGGLGFLFFLLLWGILPHWIHRNYRSANALSSSPLIEAGTAEAGAEEKRGMLREAFSPATRRHATPETSRLAFHLRPPHHNRGISELWGFLEGQIDGWTFQVPVYIDRVRMGGIYRECYHTQLWGCHCEATTISSFREAVERVFHALEHAGSLPCYAFLTSESEDPGLIPVYPWGEGWRVHEPDGPILEARDLGVLRQRVADAHGLPVEAIQMRVLSERLTWIPPAAVFRPAIGSTPWLPVAWSESGWRLHLMGALLSAPGNGAGIWSLWKAVAERGARQGWLRAPEDLTLEVWSEAAWEAIRSAMPEATAWLRFYETGQRLRVVLLPAFLHEGRWIAVYAAPGRQTVFTGRDLSDLRQRVGEALHAAGCLTDPQALRMEVSGMERSSGVEYAFLDSGR